MGGGGRACGLVWGGLVWRGMDGIPTAQRPDQRNIGLARGGIGRAEGRAGRQQVILAGQYVQAPGQPVVETVSRPASDKMIKIWTTPWPR